MATERIKIKKVNERKRNIEPPKRNKTAAALCATSIFCDWEEYNKERPQCGGVIFGDSYYA